MKQKIISSIMSIVVLVVFVFGGSAGLFSPKQEVEPPELPEPPQETQVVTKEVFFEQVKAINGTGEIEIPVIEINTEDKVFPYNKEDYINCSFKMTNTENGLYDIEREMQETAKSDGGVGIRLRGNSTMTNPKKPFRIKFNEKTSLLGLTKNKSWVLLADYNREGMKTLNYAAFTLASEFDYLDWSPTPNHVVVFINNEFQGLYLLTEQIDENSGRTNVKEDFDAGTATEFPFLVEGFWLTPSEATFEIDDGMAIEVNYPESGDCGDNYQKVLDYTQEYISAVWTTLKTGENVVVSFRSDPVGFEDLVDVDSLIDFYLVNEIMANAEGGGSSVYMYKTSTGKLKFGPVWDFDTQFVAGDQDKDGNKLLCCQHQLFFQKFLSVGKYYDLVVDRYMQNRFLISELYVHLIEYEDKIKDCSIIDSLYWYGDDKYFYNGCATVKQNLLERRKRLDEVFTLAHTEFLETIL